MFAKKKCLDREVKMHLPAIDPWTAVQKKGMGPESRALLINWLMETVDMWNCERQVLFLAVNYVDRFLCKRKICPGRLQLLGGAALMVASKMHETNQLGPKEIVACTLNTSQDQVIRMEIVLLRELSLDMAAPTALLFLELDSQGNNAKAKWICELALLDDRAQRAFLPSQIAEAAVRLSERKKPKTPAEQYLTILFKNLLAQSSSPKWAKNLMRRYQSTFSVSE